MYEESSNTFINAINMTNIVIIVRDADINITLFFC